ncbi:MAG: ammonium transporter [Steroidobacteraceae bacterium]
MTPNMASKCLWALVASLLLPGICVAQPAQANASDIAWLLTATALVLFMTLPGLALFYGGLVRSKNILSIIIQCFAITAGGSLLWLLVGYSMTFADGGQWQAWIGGLQKMGLSGVTSTSLTGTVPEHLFFMFQLTFAVITPALVIGGFAERIKYSAAIVFSLAWLLLVYVPVAHWVWGGGWLAKLGVMDFAGGIVVHVTAGTAALVAALYLGKRRGFPHVSMPPHSLPLTAAGAGMLWVGWFGFNGGSALTASGSAASAVLATHIGASSGAVAWMIVEWWRYGKPSVLGILTGVVAGLGTITPASGFVSPLSAVYIGLTAGVACFYATQLIKRVLSIDDSLDVSPVHGVGGVIGSLLTGVFAATSMGGSGFTVASSIGAQVGIQALGVGFVMLWCGAVTWGLLKMLDIVHGLRVSDEHENEGLDLASHGERAYSP